MSDRNERSERLRRRFESDKDESSKTEEDSKKSKTDKIDKMDTTPKPSKIEETDEKEKTSVKDRPSVLMYLPEGDHHALDVRFTQLNARHKEEHGEGIQKNRDYYPAVVRAALNDTTLEEELGLESNE